MKFTPPHCPQEVAQEGELIEVELAPLRVIEDVGRAGGDEVFEAEEAGALLLDDVVDGVVAFEMA